MAKGQAGHECAGRRSAGALGGHTRGSAATGFVRATRVLAVAAALLAPLGVAANPEGGRVVVGAASITQSTPKRLDIRQSTDKAILDWRGFSIGADEHTHFQQPSASAATLNRVSGADPSRILGQLSANGRVMLVNPNGVFFGPGSRVNVGALIASTADIRDEDFLAGRYAFGLASANPSAAVVNLGEIRAADGGFVVLAAPQVRNEGLIAARLGQVVLAGAETFTVDFDGDGLLQFDIGEAVKSVPRGEGGAPVEALVSNSGTVSADGGRVTLTAHAADEVIDRVINLTGVIEARTVESRGGEILLGGGETGEVHVSGRLDASGPEPGQRGGTVKVLGEKVGLFDRALVDVSGDAGGGTVLVGGNYQGKGPERNARRTYVAPSATLKADAGTYGDGGKVVVWSDEMTRYLGQASARGGRNGGKGGLVEVSGKVSLAFDGRVDVSAPQGLRGTLLLDPANLNIIDAPLNGGLLPGSLDGNVLADARIAEFDPDVGDNSVSWLAIGLLVGANVVLEATGDITIGDITGITSDIDNLVTVDVASLTVASSSGSITFADPLDTIATGGGAFGLSAGGNILVGTLDATSGVGRGGGISLKASGAINSGQIQTDGGAVALDAGGDIITGRIETGGGDISVISSGAGFVAVSAPIGTRGGSLVVETGGSIAFNAGVTTSGGGLRAEAGVNLVAGTPTLTIAPGVTLDVGTGTAILAAIGGDVVNNAGDAAIATTTGGRWLIYAADPATSLEGFSSYSKHYNETYTRGTTPSYATSGNWFLYSVAPVLLVAPGAQNITYGADTPPFTPSYTDTDFIDGDTVTTAGLGGNATWAIGGTTSSSGHWTAGVHDVSYIRTGGTGDLTSSLGYDFVDNSAGAVRTIAANLTQTNLSDRARVWRRDVFQWLDRPPVRDNAAYDLIYVAPPQYHGLWSRALRALAERPSLCAPGGRIVTQIHPCEEEGLALPGLEVVDRRRYGGVLLLFWAEPDDTDGPA